MEVNLIIEFTLERLNVVSGDEIVIDVKKEKLWRRDYGFMHGRKLSEWGTEEEGIVEKKEEELLEINTDNINTEPGLS